MIVPMKRLTLIALKSDEEKLMHALQALSAVHIIANEPSQESAHIQELENDVQRFKNAFLSLKRYAQEKKGLAPKPEISAEQLRLKLDEALEDCFEYETLERELNAVRAEIEKRQALLKTLEIWRELETNIEDIKPTRSVSYMTGLLESSRIKDLQLPEGAAMELYGEDKGLRAVLAACKTSELESLQRSLKEAGWIDFSFPNILGTPLENIRRIEEEIGQLLKEEAGLAARLKEYGKLRDEFALGQDAASVRRDREKARTELLKTNTAFVLEGWIRSDEEEKVISAVKQVTDIFYADMRDPSDDEVPPSVVENKKLIKPYEAVTNLYSRPDPRGIDGTPLMAFFYFLFFGAMLSDTGYGIVLFIGGLLYNKLMKPSGMTEGIVKVLIMGGISTAVWGVFIGTFFGLDWNVFLGTPAGTFPLLFDPMVEPMSMLFLCFGLGIVHMLFGVCIKIYMCIKAGDWAGAVFDNLSWIFIVVGLILFGLAPAVKTLGIGMAASGGVLVLLFAGRERNNILKRAIKGAGSLYNVTAYLSDMLSYARVFALGLSTGVIGNVLNTLGGMLYNSFGSGLIMQGIAFLITAALMVGLHLFSLGINVLGSFIHCARLQYVEFYGKFYEAGGIPFTPLGYRTKHVKVIGS
ncbi:MAG: V-type ATP synthase subunit I [Firmicutes bacterium ADurb.Bin182]|nr:MAG: V-type ATP synthase subunit I [Firmicutes bacterium ADurb.Bin182]